MKLKFNIIYITLFIFLVNLGYAQNIIENLNFSENQSFNTITTNNLTNIENISQYYSKEPIEKYKLKVSSKEILNEGIDKNLKNELFKLKENKHLILQFYHKLSREDLDNLKKGDIKVLNYLGGNAYYVVINDKNKNLLLEEDITTSYENIFQEK